MNTNPPVVVTEEQKQSSDALVADWYSRSPSNRLLGTESLARLRDAIATALANEAAKGEQWQSTETAPRDGTTFRAYSPELVHPDFNPWGSVECVFDGEQFIGAVWDGQFDCWNTVPVTPTLWMPLPDSPSYSREKGPQ